MDFVETTILRDTWDIDRRLSELNLTREGLLDVRAVALNEGANATPFHAANASGTFAYHAGTWALRHQFVGGDWILDRADGVEAIQNEKLKIKIAFSNVDLACNDFHVPKPRTKKGAGAERATGSDLFGDLPQYAPRPTGEWLFYYLMVDVRGAAELTRPVVKGGTFVAAVERIYLSNGGEGEGAMLLDDNSDVVDNFDPQVGRK